MKIQHSNSNVILEKQSIPDQGVLEIHTSVQIRISADQAQGLVRHWLLTDVSHMMGTDAPDLVVGEYGTWRVPVWIAFPQQGRYELGTVDVHVESGEMVNAGPKATEFQQRANSIARELPPHVPRQVAPAYHVDNSSTFTTS